MKRPPKGWASRRVPGHNDHIPGTTNYLRSRTFQSWFNMIARCYYRGSHTEKDYYYAGIRVCPRWLQSFDSFIADMGHRPHGMTLDRINPRKGYSLLNCRWATAKQQANNKRKAA